MKKVVTVKFWVEDENKDMMTDKYLYNDFNKILMGYCSYHKYDLIHFETMEIENERQDKKEKNV